MQKKSNNLEEYYQSCAFPKPAPAKKKKLLYNGYKEKAERKCWYTGRTGAERHEIWGGPWRQTSIEMGFQVDVCPEIHKELQANATPWAIAENIKWRMYYQYIYEEKLISSGIKKEQARELWMALIGKNYL